MTTDRELLELAAKAAGIRLEWDANPAEWQPMYYEGKTYHGWNPLTDDGDALQLAVKCELSLDLFDDLITAGYTATDVIEQVNEQAQPDPYAATRRAIVRAAAEIARKETT